MLRLGEREILLLSPVSILKALLKEKTKPIFSLDADQFIFFLWLKMSLFGFSFFPMSFPV